MVLLSRFNLQTQIFVLKPKYYFKTVVVNGMWKPYGFVFGKLTPVTLMIVTTKLSCAYVQDFFLELNNFNTLMLFSIVFV